MPELLSKSERILRALLWQIEHRIALGSWHPDTPKLLRSEVLPLRIPPGGIVILRDGTPGEPEVLMSPLTYAYQHRAELDIVVDGPTAARDAIFDRIRAAIGLAIGTDRTLGGLCDWVEAEAPVPVDLPIEGAEGWKAATIPVVLHYDTPDPLF